MNYIFDKKNNNDNDNDSDFIKNTILGNKLNVYIPKCIKHPVISGLSYTTGTCIGKGSNSVCYTVTSNQSQNEYVCKIIPKSLFTKFCLNEINLHMKASTHPRIIKFYRSFSDYKNVYILVEKCRKGTLLTYSLLHGSSIPIQSIQKIFCQLVDAVKHLHEKCCIVHGDLKLNNILLRRDKNKLNLQVADFGFAVQMVDGNNWKNGVLRYTPNYITPEMLKKLDSKSKMCNNNNNNNNNIDNTDNTNNEEYFGYATDMWCLGIMLYTLLYGHPPFEVKNNVEATFNKLRQEKYYFPERNCTIQQTEDEKKLEFQAKLIISQLLNSCPRQRLTISQVLKHEFLLNNDNNNELE